MITNPVTIATIGAIVGSTVTILITTLKSTFNLGDTMGDIEVNRRNLKRLKMMIEKIEDKSMDKEVCEVLNTNIKNRLERLDKKAEVNHSSIKEQMKQVSRLETKIDILLNSNGLSYEESDNDDR